MAFQPQRSQLALPAHWFVPAKPEERTNVSAETALQLEDRLTILGGLIVCPPAPQELLPLLSQLFTGQALTAAPFLPNLCFESLQTLRCDRNASQAVQSKAQELAFPRPPHPALGRIDLQAQVLLDPVLNRRARSFRRRLTAHIDVAVIGVAAVGVPSPVQFLVERVQVNVGHQRRQRTTLGSPFLAGLHHPLHHRSPP